jgi:hypothetical protein
MVRIGLAYNGRVLAGDCVNCGMSVWLAPGETREPMEHGACLITTVNSTKTASAASASTASTEPSLQLQMREII